MKKNRKRSNDSFLMKNRRSTPSVVEKFIYDLRREKLEKQREMGMRKLC